jgi:hypothetical protein
MHPQPTTETPGDIVTPLDMMRQQATESYEALKKYFDEHGEEILEEDKKREQQMIQEQKVSLQGFFGRFLGSSEGEPVAQQSNNGNGGSTSG